MKRIGIVCEGDRDFEMLTAVIDSFLGEEINYLWLHPNPEFGTNIGAGWKGVIRWCQEHSDCLYEYLSGMTPKVDFLIVQMDADVARCEKEIYCYLVDISCNGQGTEDPLNCSIAKKGLCSQKLPPNEVCNGDPKERVLYLQSILNDYLSLDQKNKYVITIPCDATDTWIVAAFEDQLTDVEKIDSPWNSIISRKKDYHGIRIPGKKKLKRPYSLLICEVCNKWDLVKQKCPQALKFENDIINVFSQIV